GTRAIVLSLRRARPFPHTRPETNIPSRPIFLLYGPPVRVAILRFSRSKRIGSVGQRFLHPHTDTPAAAVVLQWGGQAAAADRAPPPRRTRYDDPADRPCECPRPVPPGRAGRRRDLRARVHHPFPSRCSPAPGRLLRIAARGFSGA